MALFEVSVEIVTSPIMKLDIDCFHEVFDYLCLDDIISIGHTCKRLQRVSGSFIQQNFAAKRKTCANNNINMCWTPRQIGIFNPFIEKLSIFGGFLDPFEYIATNHFKSLNEFRLAQTELTAFKMECMKTILSDVEVLEVDQCSLKQEFFEHFLKLCLKLKRLSVSRSSYDRDGATIIGSDNEWMHRKYATLEHLELTDLYEFKKNDFKTLFDMNPNIRSFSIDAKSLLINRQSFLSCGAKLEKLAVDFHPENINSDVEPGLIVNIVYDLLIELHEMGFYQCLHLYITFIDRQNCLQKLFSLDSLEMLGGFITSIEMPLKKLKDLDIDKTSDVTNLEGFPSKIPTLERINFSKATSNDILPFICQSNKLKIMKIDQLMDGTYLENGVLDLVALNRERGKLIKARKLSIYVNESVFLATKWATKNINFNLIELRRGESFECEKSNSRHRFINSF